MHNPVATNNTSCQGNLTDPNSPGKRGSDASTSINPIKFPGRPLAFGSSWDGAASLRPLPLSA
jgi:hypothetical protein